MRTPPPTSCSTVRQPARPKDLPQSAMNAAAAYIARTQKPSGEIPWSQRGKTDPWDHVESAMGLTVGGFLAEARRAYEWLRRTQLADGSWWSAYFGGVPMSAAYKDANMTAYVAAGVWLYFLTTGDTAFLARQWPTVHRALDFVLSLQDPEGHVYWAKRADGGIDRRALLTGCSAVFKSLDCGLRIAAVLQKPVVRWRSAARRLQAAIRCKPHLFDADKAVYAMDWYYPVLSGAVCGSSAHLRIQQQWHRFVIENHGVRCMANRPWVTTAETAELVLTLTALGEAATARRLFDWIASNQYSDGAFWTGINLPDRIVYTREHTTWTSAAVLLAADGLLPGGPVRRLFDQPDEGGT